MLYAPCLFNCLFCRVGSHRQRSILAFKVLNLFVKMLQHNRSVTCRIAYKRGDDLRKVSKQLHFFALVGHVKICF